MGAMQRDSLEPGSAPSQGPLERHTGKILSYGARVGEPGDAIPLIR